MISFGAPHLTLLFIYTGFGLRENRVKLQKALYSTEKMRTLIIEGKKGSSSCFLISSFCQLTYRVYQNMLAHPVARQICCQTICVSRLQPLVHQYTGLCGLREKGALQLFALREYQDSMKNYFRHTCFLFSFFLHFGGTFFGQDSIFVASILVLVGPLIFPALLFTTSNDCYVYTQH